MKMRAVSLLGGALALIMTAWACGGSNSNPSPTSPSPTNPNPAPATATVTITSSGVSTKSVDLAVGGTVTVMNNDSQPHQIASNPHPVHTDCPAINALGILQPGESRATGALTVARTCGWHDHLNPGSGALQGSITIR